MARGGSPDVILAAMTRDDAIEILRAAAPELRRRYGVSSAAVFGSVARGEAANESDIDVAVSFDGATADAMTVCSVSGYLSGLMKRDVDVVALPARDADLDATIRAEAWRAF